MGYIPGDIIIMSFWKISHTTLVICEWKWLWQNLACTFLPMLTVPIFDILMSYCIIKLFDNLLSKHEHVVPSKAGSVEELPSYKKPYQSNWTEASIAMWQILCSHDYYLDSSTTSYNNERVAKIESTYLSTELSLTFHHLWL